MILHTVTKPLLPLVIGRNVRPERSFLALDLTHQFTCFYLTWSHVPKTTQASNLQRISIIAFYDSNVNE